MSDPITTKPHHRPRRILYLQYTNPAAYPSLEHSSRLLANSGYRVFFLGTGAEARDALRFPSHPYVTIRRWALPPHGWQRRIHYLWFCLSCIGWALWIKPRWIYASDPLSCPVALLLSFFPRTKVLYHEHDSPHGTKRSPDDSSAYTDRLSIFVRLVLFIRRKLARRAGVCILPNKDRAQHFSAEIGDEKKVLAVWNCPTLDEVAPPREARHGDRLRVLYQGSIVPERLPDSVLKAFAMLPEVATLDVVGYETVGSVGYVQQLRRLAGQLGIQGCVEFLGAMPRSQLMHLSRTYDVGLALIPMRSRDVNFQMMVGASVKAFDYLACGLALLVSNLPGWEETYVKPGFGLACDPEDPVSIAGALRWFLEHPAEMRAMGERGRQKVLEEWNYERQFAPVLEHLKRDRP